jgi:hypothetical protein
MHNSDEKEDGSGFKNPFRNLHPGSPEERDPSESGLGTKIYLALF